MADPRPDSDFKYIHNWNDSKTKCLNCSELETEIMARPVHRRKCDAIPINPPQGPFNNGMIIFNVIFNLLLDVQEEENNYDLISILFICFFIYYQC